MDKKEFLYFEEDDASKAKIDGKQVFITKRINGKTTRNKTEDAEKGIGNILNKNEEIVIGTDKINTQEEKENQNKNNNTRKKKQKTKHTKNRKQRRKERKKAAKFIKFMILIILIVGTIIFACASPVFSIQQIIVQGNEKLSEQTIISLSGLQKDENIFRNSKTKIEENIKENPYISEVTVKRKVPDTMELIIEERKVEYQIKVIDSYVYIDYQGYILEISTEKANVPIIEGFSTSQDTLLQESRVSNEDIEYLNTILKVVDSAKNLSIYNLITQINIEDNEYILYLESEGKYAYLGDGNNITNKMLYVQTILEEEKGKSGKIFVNGDLNNGFKPYFREE